MCGKINYTSNRISVWWCHLVEKEKCGVKKKKEKEKEREREKKRDNVIGVGIFQSIMR